MSQVLDSCQRCKFYESDGQPPRVPRPGFPAVDMGACRRYPPTPTFVPGMGPVTLWPTVCANEHCGDFQVNILAATTLPTKRQ